MTIPIHLLTFGIARFEKWLEQVLQIKRSNSKTSIFNLDYDITLTFLIPRNAVVVYKYFDFHLIQLLRKFDCVAQQID